MYPKSGHRVSPSVIRRLPKYRRCLLELKSEGKSRTSSGELSRRTGLTASQIRQDLNNFGGFGQQGYGYKVDELYDEVGLILGLDREYSVVMVGCGNLGNAVSNYLTNKPGFAIEGIFDKNPEIIGTMHSGCQVMDVDSLELFAKKKSIDIGIITTDKTSAQAVADILCEAGVRGIWNFAPIEISVPEGVVLENVHLSDSLYTLAYYMNNGKKDGK